MQHRHVVSGMHPRRASGAQTSATRQVGDPPARADHRPLRHAQRQHLAGVLKAASCPGADSD